MGTLSLAPPAEFRPFLTFVRQCRDEIVARHGALDFCMALIDGDCSSPFLERGSGLLAALDPDVQDYAVSSAYARLIGDDARRALSAYFTPPALAQATLAAIADLVGDADGPLRVLDPACGGGSFLVPTARMLIGRRVAAGMDAASACRDVLTTMRGIEIEPGLARISAALLRRMVAREWGVDADVAELVTCGDALAAQLPERYDLAIGNPPYGKVWRSGAAKVRGLAGRADRGGHTNLYALFVIRALDWLRPGGGLAFVLPTSFVAGPYFSGLRQEILDRAAVVRIDLHQQREDLFLDATQDVCLLVLRRHGETAEVGPYALGLIDGGGARLDLGTADAPSGGEPWSLPVPSDGGAARHHRLIGRSSEATLADYGYRMRVGKVVPTREAARLHRERGPGRLPVIWASDVRPDGSFSFQAGSRTAKAAWYSPASTDRVRYASVGRSVLVQRTSNRDQRRLLNAAVVSRDFADEHAEHGYVAENHVIVLEPVPEGPAVTPDLVAALLNSAAVNRRFSAVSGGFSVSARLLARLALPPPEDLPAVGEGFEARLEPLLGRLDGVLVRLSGPGVQVEPG